MSKLSREVGTNLPTHKIVELLDKLGRGMSEVQMVGKFIETFSLSNLNTIQTKLINTNRAAHKLLCRIILTPQEWPSLKPRPDRRCTESAPKVPTGPAYTRMWRYRAAVVYRTGWWF